MALKIEKTLPYSKKNLYDLVADVERYPDFLPWLKSAVVYPKNDQYFEADLTVKFSPFQKTYRSEVFLYEDKIEAKAKPGDLFKNLESVWTFKSVDENTTTITFTMEFEFYSKLIQAAMGKVFESACETMIKAFEERASNIY